MFFVLTSSLMLFAYNQERFTFNPDRYLGDGLTCAQSAALPDAMERDHWTFGAG